MCYLSSIQSVCSFRSCSSYAVKRLFYSKPKPFNTIPGPLCLPLWGNLYQYKFGYYDVLNYHRVLQNLYEKYGQIAIERHGKKHVVHVFDPDDAKTIFHNEGNMPYVVPLQETAELYRKTEQLSLGLGNTNGEEWYRLRSAIRHLMLKPQDVLQFLPATQLVTDDLINVLKKTRRTDGTVRDLRRLLAKWNQESSGVICFGTRLGCMSGGESETFGESIIMYNEIAFHLAGVLKFALPIYELIPTPKWKKLVEAENFITGAAVKNTNVALAQIEAAVIKGETPGSKYSFLTSLLTKPELSKKDIVILTLSLFVDGLSTTVPMLLYIMYCLAMNPAEQQKAYEEISRVVTKSEITSQNLNKLSYVKAVVKETFRLYPNGTEISRIIQKELVLSGYSIPAKTHVNINMNVHFKSEQYFSEPERFCPARWIRGGEGDEINPFILTPFGHGARTCAGRRFAEQDLYVAICKILAAFELKYPEGEPPLEQVYNTLLFPAVPLKIQFLPRVNY